MPEVPETSEHPKLTARILQSLPELTRFVRGKMDRDMRRRESASDIVQSTFRSLLQSEASFQDRGEASFKAWLRTAALNKLRTRTRSWRAQRRGGGTTPVGADLEAVRQNEPAAPDSTDPVMEAQVVEEAERLQRAFAALAPDVRALLVRSQIDGASHTEIARETGQSPTTVRRAVARALALLAADLEV
jgi:RNA polymerase sigma-70 factor (ECF subfamily)